MLSVGLPYTLAKKSVSAAAVVRRAKGEYERGLKRRDRAAAIAPRFPKGRETWGTL